MDGGSDQISRPPAPFCSVIVSSTRKLGPSLFAHIASAMLLAMGRSSLIAIAAFCASAVALQFPAPVSQQLEDELTAMLREWRALYAVKAAQSPPDTDANRAPRLVYKVEPEYTEEAKAAKVAGRVVLGIRIGREGRLQSLHVIRPLGWGLDEKAAEALRQWRFEPALRNGEPVTTQATVEINFRPPD